MTHGKYTAMLGRLLEKEFKEKAPKNLRLIYDHAPKETVGGEKRYKTVPYFRNYGRESTLSHVDLVVIDTDSRTAVLICEIEEAGARLERTVEPKKIIGDTCNLFLARKLRVMEADYDIGNSVFVLGIKVNDSKRSRSREKAESLRLAILEMVNLNFQRNIRIEYICESEPNLLIDRVASKIREVVGFSDSQKLQL
jgi:hypothetical protein